MLVALEEFQRQVRACSHAYDTTIPAITAEERYGILRNLDPYPKVPPTLLHAGQIASYVLAAGIIDPFEPDEYLTKPATYLVPLEGPCRYRNSKNDKVSFYLTDDATKRGTQVGEVRDQIELEPNSICYVTLKPTFRIPNYLACRFNLKIREVYRGLLVGTGPLVDPGFVGSLSLPIHNLTNETYVLRPGEGFVYFEFTKLDWKNGSRTIPAWVKPALTVQPPFPDAKRSKEMLDDYLQTATGHGPPQQALMVEISRLSRISNLAETTLERFRNIGIVALVLAGVAVLGLVIATLTFGQSAVNELIAFEQAERAELSSQKDAQLTERPAIERPTSDVSNAVATLPSAQTRPSGVRSPRPKKAKPPQVQ